MGRPALTDILLGEELEPEEIERARNLVTRMNPDPSEVLAILGLNDG